MAAFNRTHLALTSKHLAVEEAVKFARAKSVQNQRSRQSWLHPIPRRQPLFQTSAESKRLRELSSKLSKLDVLLRQVGSILFIILHPVPLLQDLFEIVKFVKFV